MRLCCFGRICPMCRMEDMQRNMFRDLNHFDSFNNNKEYKPMADKEIYLVRLRGIENRLDNIKESIEQKHSQNTEWQKVNDTLFHKLLSVNIGYMLITLYLLVWG